MSPDTIRLLAAMILSGCCVLLLLTIFIQMNMDQFAPAQYASTRTEWAEDFAEVRAEIARQELAERLGQDHPDWKFDTVEWNRAYLDFFGQPAEGTFEAQRAGA